MTELTPVERYETLLGQLKEIVARLEGGELPLDEALTLYERGVQVSARCQQLLDAAELKVQQLQAGMFEAEGA